MALYILPLVEGTFHYLEKGKARVLCMRAREHVRDVRDRVAYAYRRTRREVKQYVSCVKKGEGVEGRGREGVGVGEQKDGYDVNLIRTPITFPPSWELPHPSLSYLADKVCSVPPHTHLSTSRPHTAVQCYSHSIVEDDDLR